MNQGIDFSISWGGKYCRTHWTLAEDKDKVHFAASSVDVQGLMLPVSLALTYDECTFFFFPESTHFRREVILSWQAGRLATGWESVGGVFKFYTYRELVVFLICERGYYQIDHYCQVRIKMNLNPELPSRLILIHKSPLSPSQQKPLLPQRANTLRGILWNLA